MASNAARRTVESLLRDATEAQRAGRASHAMDLCEAALRLDPANVDALCAYGSLATNAGDAETGAQAGLRATKLRPEHAPAHHCLGTAMRHLGRLQDAQRSLSLAVKLDPARADSLFELASTFLDSGDAGSAEPFLNRGLDIDGDSSTARFTLARSYRCLGRFDEAVSACRQAIRSDPTKPEPFNLLGNMLRDSGATEDAIDAFERAIAVAPDRPDTWSSLLLTMQCSDKLSARDVAARHRDYGRHFGTLLRPLPSAPRLKSGNRVKIGYLSANFRRHAVAKFFEPLIESHDRNRFDIYCYHSHAVVDEVTHRIRERAEHFSSVWGMRDGHVAARVRRDGIDILVDLDGHTAPNRLPVFFLRAAPIQVSWLGYLSTTGVPAIDYRLTDSRADPEGIADDLHVETLWRLPTTAWCYRPYDEAPRPGPLPAAANGFVTFVSLNNPGKVTTSVLELWARIMRDVEMSRLILHIVAQPTRLAEVEAFFAVRGIDARRLLLVDRQSISEYLALYNCADIALDTWPCAGGTTTCDALSMGVPVVSLVGEASFSRTGASMLSSVGLSDLAVDTPDAYVAGAVGLARDAHRLAALRADLPGRLRSSCLTNGAEFARQVEAAFVEMHARRASGHRGTQS